MRAIEKTLMSPISARRQSRIQRALENPYAIATRRRALPPIPNAKTIVAILGCWPRRPLRGAWAIEPGFLLAAPRRLAAKSDPCLTALETPPA
jgi:hypothetical protein